MFLKYNKYSLKFIRCSNWRCRI